MQDRDSELTSTTRVSTCALQAPEVLHLLYDGASGVTILRPAHIRVPPEFVALCILCAEILIEAFVHV